MKSFAIRRNQNVFDACIQAYGSMEYMNQLLIDNPTLSYDSDVLVGDVIQYDETVGVLRVNQKRDTENINYSNGSVISDFVLGTQGGDYIVTDGGDFIKISL